MSAVLTYGMVAVFFLRSFNRVMDVERPAPRCITAQLVTTHNSTPS